MDEVLYLLQVAEPADDTAFTIAEEKANTIEGIQEISQALERSRMVFVVNCTGGQFGDAEFSWDSVHANALASDNAEVFCQSAHIR